MGEKNQGGGSGETEWKGRLGRGRGRGKGKQYAGIDTANFSVSHTKYHLSVSYFSFAFLLLAIWHNSFKNILDWPLWSIERVWKRRSTPKYTHCVLCYFPFSSRNAKDTLIYFCFLGRSRLTMKFFSLGIIHIDSNYFPICGTLIDKCQNPKDLYMDHISTGKNLHREKMPSFTRLGRV